MTDISVTNGIAAEPVQDGDASTYTVQITPTDADSNVEISIRANGVRDEADLNSNVESPVTISLPVQASAEAQMQQVMETTAPTIISVVRRDPMDRITNADSLTWRVTFSEAVRNVDSADFTVTGTDAVVTDTTVEFDDALLGQSPLGTTWDITVSGGNLASLNGGVTLDFASGQDIADGAGNVLANTMPTGTNNNSYIIDNTAPTVVSVLRRNPLASITNADSLTWRVTFSEAVQNVDDADFEVSNMRANVTDVEAVGNGQNIYDVTVLGGSLASANDGRVALIFTSTQDIQDATGNPLTNTAPTGANENFAVENVPPVLEFRGGLARQPDGTWTARVVVAEAYGLAPGTVLEDGDLELVNARAEITGGGFDYGIILTPIADGPFSIGSRAGALADVPGNQSDAVAPMGATHDGTAPTVEITGAPANIRGRTPFDITITFDEPVNGFDAVSDIAVTNGTNNSPAPSVDRTVYTARITPDGAGPVTIQVPANAAQDAQGNNNTESDPVVVTFIPVGDVTLVVSAAEAGTVRFTSQTPALNDLSITVAGGGTGANGPITVDAGSHVVNYILPVGFSVTSASCSAAGSTVDRKAKRLSLDVEPDASVTCTLSVQDTATRTARQVRDFMEDRARLIMANRSDRNRRVARLRGSITPSSFSIADHAMPAALPLPVAIALGARKGEEKAQLSYSCTHWKRTRPAACRNDFWVEGTLGRYTSSDNDAKGHYGIVHGGFDRRVGKGLLIGIGAQFDRVVRNGEADKQAADIKGNGWMAGPYVTARLHENLYFDGGIRAGTASNRITMPGAGFTDTFTSWRWGAHATLLGDFDAGRFNFRPSASFVWFEETAKSWTDGNDLRIPEVRTRKGDLEGGLRVSHTTPDGQSSQYVEVDGVFALTNGSGKFGLQGSRKREHRVRLGLGATVADLLGGTLDAGLSFEGLGRNDWETYAVRLGYSVSPDWLPGTIDAGLSFNGLGVDEWDSQALNLGFRSTPDTWLGGVFSTGLSYDGSGGADDDPLSGVSGKVGYEVRF